MRRVFSCLVVVIFVFSACNAPMTPDGSVSTGTAEERTSGFMELLADAQVSGDYSAVLARAEADDPSGQLTALVAQQRSDVQQCIVQGTPTPLGALPLFGDSGYRNGDVLVCKGSTSLTSIIMNLVLVGGYGHAGILDLGVFDGSTEPEGDRPCILSADVDYLSSSDPGDAALTYETYDDWINNNDIITVLHSNRDDSADLMPMQSALAQIYELHPDTTYSFLSGAFMPVNRHQNSVWYCSMVPWRVYDLVGSNVENGQFYFGPDTLWMAFRESILYDVYWIYLRLTHPFRTSSWVTLRANDGLKAILTELITPDELRMSGALSASFYVDANGLVPLSSGNPYADMSLVW